MQKGGFGEMRRALITSFSVFFVFSLVITYGCASTSEWVQRANRPVRGQYIDCVTYDNKIYTINGRLSGGDLPRYERQCNLHVYDPLTCQWTRKANPIVNGDAGTSGVIDGAVYYTHFYSSNISVTGHPTGRSCLAYNISSDSWSWRADNNQASRAHWDANGGVVGSKLYVIGGTSDSAGWATNDVFEYDPLTNSWARKTPAPANMFKFGVGVCQNRIYCFGRKVYVYTPSSDLWETKCSCPNAKYVADDSYTWCSKRPANGSFYVMFNYKGTTQAPDVYKYDIAGDSFTFMCTFPIRTAINHCSGNVVYDSIYHIGGTLQPENTAHGWLFEFTPSLTSIGAAKAINYGVQDLPSSAFAKPEEDVEDVKSDFVDKFADVIENIYEENYEYAVERLDMIRERIHEQIVESSERERVVLMIEDLIADLRSP